MLSAENSDLKIAVLTLGCLSLIANPACTGSHAINAKIDFAIHARENELGISLDASASSQTAEESGSSRSLSDNPRGR